MAVIHYPRPSLNAALSRHFLRSPKANRTSIVHIRHRYLRAYLIAYTAHVVIALTALCPKIGTPRVNAVSTQRLINPTLNAYFGSTYYRVVLFPAK
jgi:hypothetical protein|tara:strand:+ start:659 stop:946 length:288 start_codon:yes stop_codon:yes gene_type:complete